MKSLLLRSATPYITGLFLISLISGVALFFHIGPAGFHGMHEWLSMVLILPFALHIWKNWRPMTAYLKRASFAIAMAVSLAAAAIFLLPSGGETGGNPAFGLLKKVLSSSPTALAPILGIAPEQLVSGLTDAGYSVASADQPLTEIAAASGKDTMAIAATLTQLGK